MGAHVLVSVVDTYDPRTDVGRERRIGAPPMADHVAGAPPPMLAPFFVYRSMCHLPALDYYTDQVAFDQFVLPRSFTPDGGGSIVWSVYRLFDGIPIPTRVDRDEGPYPHDLGPGPYDDGGKATLLSVRIFGPGGARAVPPGPFVSDRAK